MKLDKIMKKTVGKIRLLIKCNKKLKNLKVILKNLLLNFMKRTNSLSEQIEKEMML